MPYQPNLFTPEPADITEQPSGAALRTGGESRAELEARIHPPASQHRARQKYARWLERAELLVRVIVRLYLGLLITALPWMRFWTENGLLNFNRTSSLISGSGFTRGLVSGLGLLNVVIALHELFLPRSSR